MKLAYNMSASSVDIPWLIKLLFSLSHRKRYCSSFAVASFVYNWQNKRTINSNLKSKEKCIEIEVFVRT